MYKRWVICFNISMTFLIFILKNIQSSSSINMVIKLHNDNNKAKRYLKYILRLEYFILRWRKLQNTSTFQKYFISTNRIGYRLILACFPFNVFLPKSRVFIVELFRGQKRESVTIKCWISIRPLSTNPFL